MSNAKLATASDQFLQWADFLFVSGMYFGLGVEVSVVIVAYFTSNGQCLAYPFVDDDESNSSEMVAPLYSELDRTSYGQRRPKRVFLRFCHEFRTNVLGSRLLLAFRIWLCAPIVPILIVVDKMIPLPGSLIPGCLKRYGHFEVLEKVILIGECFLIARTIWFFRMIIAASMCWCLVHLHFIIGGLIVFIIGLFMMLVPSIPPILPGLLTGIAVGGSGLLSGLSFWESVPLAILLSMLYKIASVCVEWWLGKSLMKGTLGPRLKAWVDRNLGRGGRYMKAAEIILTRGSWFKRIILLNCAPDWPTSVISGFLGMKLIPLLLASLPSVLNFARFNYMGTTHGVHIGNAEDLGFDDEFAEDFCIVGAINISIFFILPQIALYILCGEFENQPLSRKDVENENALLTDDAASPWESLRGYQRILMYLSGCLVTFSSWMFGFEGFSLDQDYIRRVWSWAQGVETFPSFWDEKHDVVVGPLSVKDSLLLAWALGFAGICVHIFLAKQPDLSSDQQLELARTSALKNG